MTQIRVSHIVIGPRHRKDMGDIDALVVSIEEVGQLQPVVLDKDMRLVAGMRRLEAFKAMGRPLIDAVIVGGLDDAVKALTAERDENTCRKDFTPTEAVAVGRSLEEQLRPLAERNRGRGRWVDLSNEEKVPGGSRDAAAAAAVGMGAATYWRAKTVVRAAEQDPAVFGDLPERMDRTGSVSGTHQEMTRRKILNNRDASVEQIVKFAAEGLTSQQIAERLGFTQVRPDEAVRRIAKEHSIDIVADKVLGRNFKRLDSNRIVTETVNSLRGVGSLLDHVDYSEVDPALVGEWVDSLTDAISALSKLKRNLKESTRATA